MRFRVIYLLIFIFSLLLSTTVFAEERTSNDKLKTEIILLEKKYKKLTYKKPATRFFYLLGSVGYNLEYVDYNLQTREYKKVQHGYNLNLISGWQVWKYFAMELGVTFTQGLQYRLTLNYALLLQPYIKINNSWGIMPKIGLGASVYRILDVGKEFVMNENVGLFISPIIGLKANYKKYIFGVSYQWDETFDTKIIIGHKLTVEAGIIF